MCFSPKECELFHKLIPAAVGRRALGERAFFRADSFLCAGKGKGAAARRQGHLHPLFPSDSLRPCSRDSEPDQTLSQVMNDHQERAADSDSNRSAPGAAPMHSDCTTDKQDR